MYICIEVKMGYASSICYYHSLVPVFFWKMEKIFSEFLYKFIHTDSNSCQVKIKRMKFLLASGFDKLEKQQSHFEQLIFNGNNSINVVCACSECSTKFVFMLFTKSHNLLLGLLGCFCILNAERTVNHNKALAYLEYCAWF